MINLELLEVISLVIAVLALWRLRPTTFVIAGNQLLVLRALVNIRDFGQPASEWQNPAALFSLDQLAVASRLFAMSSAILLVLALANPRSQPAKPSTLPAVPRWLLGITLLFGLAAATATRTILAVSRSSPDHMISESTYALTASGLSSMLDSVLLYELYRRVAIGRLRPAWAFLSIVALFTVTDFLQGQTGLAIGYIVCAAILLLGAAGGRPTIRRRMAIGTLILGAVLAAAMVRHIREDVWRDGWDSVARFSTSLLNEEPSKSQNAEGMETEGNGTAYAAQVLEGIALYDGGRSRQWQSLLDPVIYTFEPSFLIEPLGLTRHVSAAVELQHIFVSGGGSYILGELYWNGGYPCVVFGFLLVALWAFLCDTRYRNGGLWLMLTCQFGPSLLESIGYGVTQTFRCWFDGLLVVGGYLLLRWVRRPRASRPPRGIRPIASPMPVRDLLRDGSAPPPR